LRGRDGIPSSREGTSARIATDTERRNAYRKTGMPALRAYLVAPRGEAAGHMPGMQISLLEQGENTGGYRDAAHAAIIINGGKTMTTKQELIYNICSMGIVDEPIEQKKLRKMTIAQLRKVWDEGVIVDCGR